MLGLAPVIEKFVWGESGPEAWTNKMVSTTKARAAASWLRRKILFIFIHHCWSLIEFFRDFDDFTLKCGKPIATVLSSSRDLCPKCGRKLVFENKAIPVIIYSNHQGTHLGSRLTKLCRKCKIYEHHGHWPVDGKRHFNRDSVLSEFLFSSEDTAFQMDVLAQCNNLLLISAVLLCTYVAGYNRCFEYSKMATMNDIDAKVKRSKGMLIISLQR